MWSARNSWFPCHGRFPSRLIWWKPKKKCRESCLHCCFNGIRSDALLTWMWFACSRQWHWYVCGKYYWFCDLRSAIHLCAAWFTLFELVRAIEQRSYASCSNVKSVFGCRHARRLWCVATHELTLPAYACSCMLIYLIMRAYALDAHSALDTSQHMYWRTEVSIQANVCRLVLISNASRWNTRRHMHTFKTWDSRQLHTQFSSTRRHLQIHVEHEGANKNETLMFVMLQITKNLNMLDIQDL